MKHSFLALALLGFAFSSCSHTKTDAHKEKEAHHAAHWGYQGDTGSAHWGEISEKFKLCSSGKNQSPINITGDFDVKLPSITFNYNTNPTKIVNNGHTVQVDIAAGSNISVDGNVFNLKQFHFHTPSENTINGKHFPLEAHYVHRSNKGEYAVVAVMFNEGAANPVLDEIWAKMPTKKRETVKLQKRLNFAKLRPENTDYYYFNGSFTTPPCTEGVYWHVIKQPLTASKAQIAKFLSVMHHPNNRVLQKTGARVIVE